MLRRLDPVTVTPYPDGPIVIRGPVVVMAEDGGRVLRSRNATALCRCRLSGATGATSRPAASGGRPKPAPTPDTAAASDPVPPHMTARDDLSHDGVETRPIDAENPTQGPFIDISTATVAPTMHTGAVRVVRSEQ